MGNFRLRRKRSEDKHMQFGMPTLIENRRLEDNVALCNELGLQFVELNMNFPEYRQNIWTKRTGLCVWLNRLASTTPSTWMRT